MLLMVSVLRYDGGPSFDLFEFQKEKKLHCICDCPTIQKPFHFHIFLFLFIFLLMVILQSGLDFRSFMRFVSFFLVLTLTNRSA